MPLFSACFVAGVILLLGAKLFCESRRFQLQSGATQRATFEKSSTEVRQLEKCVDM